MSNWFHYRLDRGRYLNFYKTILFVVVLCAFGTSQASGPFGVSAKRNNLYLIGTFDESTYTAVTEILDSNPNIDTIVFTANGGSVHDSSTLALGREIRRRGMNTHLVNGGVLASGGLSLFMAGNIRTMGSAPLVGVHSWQHCWREGSSVEQCKDAREHPRADPGHELHGNYTEEMLGKRDFYWFAIEAAPSTSIHWMRPEEIAEYELINSNVQPSDVMNPFSAKFHHEKRRVCGEC